METLPDYLGKPLHILSIGCNPSPMSVARQCYFANPRNRFWAALNASGLIQETLQPETAAMERLLNKYHIGFTDVVKRCTPGVADLNAADYRRDAPLLLEKCKRYQPTICWFHGKVAYQHFLRYALGKKGRIDWGWQPLQLGQSKVFVTPNPSPANAAYSLDTLIEWYSALHQRQKEEK